MRTARTREKSSIWLAAPYDCQYFRTNEIKIENKLLQWMKIKTRQDEAVHLRTSLMTVSSSSLVHGPLMSSGLSTFCHLQITICQNTSLSSQGSEPALALWNCPGVFRSSAQLCTILQGSPQLHKHHYAKGQGFLGFRTCANIGHLYALSTPPQPSSNICLDTSPQAALISRLHQASTFCCSFLPGFQRPWWFYHPWKGDSKGGQAECAIHTKGSLPW